MGATPGARRPRNPYTTAGKLVDHGTWPIADFAPHRLRYFPSPTALRHNFDRDIHLFLLWERSRRFERTIIEDIRSRFAVLGCFEIYWSEAHVLNNFARLYNWTDAATISKPESVGHGPFICVIVENDSPSYSYVQTASGRVELAATEIVARKQMYRELVGGQFLVHSTTSISEFFTQATLLLGEPLVRHALAGRRWDGTVRTLHRDLTGSDGWTDLGTMFATLRLATNALVLRNFEHLPDHIDGDIDLLCDDLERLVAVLNASRRGRHRWAREIVVDGAPIPIDIRVIGDGYYDARWEADMLHRQVLHEGMIPRPRDDDYFFSLLYHAFLHKPSIKAEYVDRLPALAQRIGFTAFDAGSVASSHAVASVLDGYLQAMNYSYAIPDDAGVETNPRGLRILGLRRSRTIRARIGRRIYLSLAAVLPRRFKDALSDETRTRVRRMLRMKADARQKATAP